MQRSRQQIVFLLIALAVGVSFPYLLDLASRAFEENTAAVALAPLNQLSAAERLESACNAVVQLNNRLNQRDQNRPSFLQDIKQLQRVRPELQEIHHLVCGRKDKP